MTHSVSHVMRYKKNIQIFVSRGMGPVEKSVFSVFLWWAVCIPPTAHTAAAVAQTNVFSCLDRGHRCAFWGSRKQRVRSHQGNSQTLKNFACQKLPQLMLFEADKFADFNDTVVFDIRPKTAFGVLCGRIVQFEAVYS